MAVTSNWSWDAINRQKDYTIINGQNLFRENWSLTRSRISNDTYDSDLGDSSNSLEAYNGGITETIIPPTYTTYTFGTTRNWVTSGVLWIPTGFNRGGVPSFKSIEASKTNSTFIPVLFLGTVGGASRYVIGQATPSEIASGSWPNSSEEYTTLSLGWAAKYSSYTTLTGTYSNGAGGSPAWSGDSSFGSTSTNATFYCTGDIQSYETKGVEWFTQTQTWQSKTPWG